jgi:Flp pilus assembly protein TadG
MRPVISTREIVIVIRRHKRRTRGATLLEFAVVAPLIFLFFFAAFEYSRFHSIRQTAHLAAFEGARRGIVPGATANDVQKQVDTILNTVGVQQAVVTIKPATLKNAAPSITVRIKVPIRENSWVPLHLLGDTTFDAACTLHRERL